MTQVDIKLLWGRAGGRCSICKAKLTADKTAIKGEIVLGEHAHIVGETEKSPRGNSSLSMDDRSGYHNRILLCPNDHTIIDKDVESFPIEKLHMIKTGHELWVESQLSSSDMRLELESEVYASIVDIISDKCMLANWDGWTRTLLRPRPAFSVAAHENLNDFRRSSLKWALSGQYPDIDNSAMALSHSTELLVRIHNLHSEVRDEDFYSTFPFYKRYYPNPNYDEELKRYSKWEDLVHSTVIVCTKTANLFADIVRRDFNPKFFAVEGRYEVTEGPFSDMDWRTWVPVFDSLKTNSVLSNAAAALELFEEKIKFELLEV